ncbi:MAG: hypothetical protein N3B18_13185 [Desulfobacterota bacterium]|nr:hypothetical protein [Thermodesulfobacteriota bacterium]
MDSNVLIRCADAIVQPLVCIEAGHNDHLVGKGDGAALKEDVESAQERMLIRMVPPAMHCMHNNRHPCKPSSPSSEDACL